MNFHSPPKWIKAFLHWYCKEEHLETIEGDLDEEFQDLIERKGIRAARRFYFIEVIRFIRAYTVKNKWFKPFNNNTGMLRNYFKTSFRNIVRSKAFSFINIVGFSVSLSLSIMILLMLHGVLQTDKYHDEANRIYRITTEKEMPEETIEMASTSTVFVPFLQTGFPGVEDVLRIGLKSHQRARVDLGYQPIDHLYADQNFFTFFNFEVKYGDKNTFFNTPSGIVLSERTSLNLFGEVNPVGEVVTFDTKESFIVNGVLRDLPRNRKTHLRFDAISSFKYLENQQLKGVDQGIDDFERMWDYYVYAKLFDGTNPDLVVDKLNDFTDRNYKSREASYSFAFQGLKEISPGKLLRNEMENVIPYWGMYLILSLIGFLMFIACFNYTNLSIARAIHRSREVGIRKVLGATRRQMVFQFLTESITISFLALILAFPLHDFVMVPMLETVNSSIVFPKITDLQLVELAGLFLFTFLTGILAGIVPAILLSSIKIVNVMKGANNINLLSRIKLRKVLIVVQFMISMILITSVVTSSKQYIYQRKIDYGFNHENIINIELQNIDYQVLKNELSGTPGVTKITASNTIPGLGTYDFTAVKIPNAEDFIMTERVIVDHEFLDAYGLKLLAGNDFLLEDGSYTDRSIVVTESLIQAAGFENPHTAIGQILMEGEKQLVIAGVINDFTAISLRKNSPMILKIDTEKYKYLSLRIQAASALSIAGSIEDIWLQLEPENPVQYSVFSETIEELSRSIRDQVVMFVFFAGIVIVIAVLGLFGMAIFSSESRVKEVGIRKVMGGSVQQITMLLSRDFVKLVAIGVVCGTPIGWFLNDLMLRDYKYRMDMSVSIFITSALIMFALAFLTIGSQTLKAARSNPVSTLRQEQ